MGWPKSHIYSFRSELKHGEIMIKTIEQARDVQAARVANGKRGWARSVRRFLMREYGDKDLSLWHKRVELKSSLPHLPIIPDPEPEEPNGNVVEEEVKPKRGRKPKVKADVADGESESESKPKRKRATKKEE